MKHWNLFACSLRLRSSNNLHTFMADAHFSLCCVFPCYPFTFFSTTSFSKSSSLTCLVLPISLPILSYVAFRGFLNAPRDSHYDQIQLLHHFAFNIQYQIGNYLKYLSLLLVLILCCLYSVTAVHIFFKIVTPHVFNATLSFSGLAMFHRDIQQLRLALIFT